MTKTPHTVKNSFKTSSVSPAKALSAAKRVRDSRAGKSAASASYKSAPALVRK